MKATLERLFDHLGWPARDNASLNAQTGDVLRRRPLCFGEPSTQPWTLPVSSRAGKTHTLVNC